MYTHLRTSLYATAFFTASFCAVTEAHAQINANPVFVEYTVVYEYVSRLGQATTQDTVAVRHDGSRSMVSRALSKQDTYPSERAVVDVISGINSNIDPLTRTVLNRSLPADRIAYYKHKPDSCESALNSSPGDLVSCEQSSHETRFGRPVINASVHHTDSNGQIMDFEYLLDPGLNWTALEIRTKIHPDERAAIKRAISLKIGHPDDALFTIPDGYAETLLPSQYIDGFRKARN